MNEENKERNIEIRFVIRTPMTDDELNIFTEEMETEFNEHLLTDEKVLASLYTDKVSYESVQLLNVKGEE